MKEEIELLILDTVKKHGSIMPLFKAGYAYSKVMEWGKQLEQGGELFYSEDGIRSLTKKGEERRTFLKKRKHSMLILPLEQYRVQKIDVDDIYLP